MLKFYWSYVIIWSEKWMIHIIHSNGSDINVIIPMEVTENIICVVIHVIISMAVIENIMCSKGFLFNKYDYFLLAFYEKT